MFDTVLGLPVHPLVVHGVVVLLPLTALVTVWWAWQSPPTRPRLGWVVVGADLAVAVLTWVAKQSGEALQARLGGEAALEHADIATWLPWFAFGVAGAALAVQLARRSASGLGMPRQLPAAVVTAVVLGALVWTFRTGHSGSEAVWSQIVRNTSK